MTPAKIEALLAVAGAAEEWRQHDWHSMTADEIRAFLQTPRSKEAALVEALAHWHEVKDAPPEMDWDDPHFVLQFFAGDGLEYELELDDFQIWLRPSKYHIQINLSGNDLNHVVACRTIAHRTEEAKE